MNFKNQSRDHRLARKMARKVILMGASLQSVAFPTPLHPPLKSLAHTHHAPREQKIRQSSEVISRKTEKAYVEEWDFIDPSEIVIVRFLILVLNTVNHFPERDDDPFPMPLTPLVILFR
jgi:hypothetical protein